MSRRAIRRLAGSRAPHASSLPRLRLHARYSPSTSERSRPPREHNVGTTFNRDVFCDDFGLGLFRRRRTAPSRDVAAFTPIRRETSRTGCLVPCDSVERES